MKKRTKVILIILAVLAVLVIAGVLGARHFLLNGISEEEKAQIQKEVETVAEEVVQEIEEEKALQEEQAAAGEDPDTAGVDKGISDGTVAKGTKTWNSQAQQIVSRYYNGMCSLQGKANGMVDGLVSSAVADYNAAVAAGASKSELAALASSYSSRAAAMEGSVDSSVNALMSSMASELRACGVSESEINAQVSSMKGAYASAKAAKRGAAMSRIPS